jgi:hypothetical protein
MGTMTAWPSETSKACAETKAEASMTVSIQKLGEQTNGSAEYKKDFDGSIEIDDDVALTFPQRVSDYVCALRELCHRGQFFSNCRDARILHSTVFFSFSFSQIETTLFLELTKIYLKLMEILDNEDYADIIAWLPHDRGFVIFRKKAFELKILPKHFHKQSKYSSFTRKLNRWGFVRVTRGPETGSYYNEFFRRDGHRLCMQMSCQSNTKFSGSSTSNVVAPDFSRIPAVMPIVDSGMYSHNPDPTLQMAMAEEAAMQQARKLAQLQQAQVMERELQMHRASMFSQESMLLQAMGGRHANGLAALTQLGNMNGNSSFFGTTMPFQMPHQS